MLPYEEMMSLPAIVAETSYTAKDTILYALGVGVGTPPSDDDLQFVYEENLKALPTMAVVIGHPGFFLQQPKYEVDWRKLLHGEQRLEIHKALPPEGKIKSVLTFEEIYDKGPDKGALLLTSKKIYDLESGDLLATSGATLFLRGDGGCGGKSGSAPKPHPVPERSPDVTIQTQTRTDQALIYRLSGDMNPLHADPKVAKDAGFEKPILHGLCTYGVVGRSLLKELCADDVSRLKRYDVRFSRPTYPGDALVIDIWKESDGQAAICARAADRDEIVLNNGFVLYDE